MENGRSTFSSLPLVPAFVTVCLPGALRRVLATTWVGVVCADPVVILVGLQGRMIVPPRQRAKFDFVVSFPAEPEPLAASWSEAGETLQARCRTRIDCRGGSLQKEWGQEVLRGEVRDFLSGESRFTVRELCSPNRGGAGSPFLTVSGGGGKI